MIISGYKPKVLEIASGVFYCPHCNQQRAYKHKRAARYYVLFFIPLFETKNLGEYIECQGCFKFFTLDVLESKPKRTDNQIVQIQTVASSEQSHPELLTIWQGLYDSLECESILNSRRWSSSISGCAELMKRTGASIFIKDYKTARNYLKMILDEKRDTDLLNLQFSAKKLPSIFQDHPEFAQKYEQFAKAVNILLTKLP